MKHVAYLLDTDYVIDYLKGHPHATELLDRLYSDGLALSIITFAEVSEGIFYGVDPKQSTQMFRRFLEGVKVVGMNRSIAKLFAVLRGELRQQTKSLGDPKHNYDLFIAATASYYNLTLLTRNVKDYHRIPHLKLYQ